ncbi:hypothetical protein NC652_014006 [Populus alba x Populus x berolinensis]|uniref:Uncharacterized protein n=1 Tax=Populus alba x Populus x berolinensis TaxID=444605 RepID=A0AAD6QVZ6_9ROSI|nr:hypothetical protein NC652_014006 [Populus alba x Populus x berolinensis]KAJ6997573.1 hypothetical protein NC653_013974 [Populus alba x Populus x berolinensis]
MLQGNEGSMKQSMDLGCATTANRLSIIKERKPKILQID